MQKVLLGLVVAVAACGGSDGVSINDFSKQYLDAFCKGEVACGQFPDQATCVGAFQADDMFFLTMQADVASKKVKYDSGQAGSCISEASKGQCTFTGLYPDTNDPCAKIFTGTVATGGACFDSNECADKGVCNATDPNCDPNSMCCAGTCAAAPMLAALGQPCQGTGTCADGSYCSPTSNTCTALVATEGGACDDFYACSNPRICNFDFNTMAFTTCYTPAARNATCDPNNIFPCADERDYCDTTTMKCTPLVATGASCGGSNGAGCVAYDTCDMTSMMCTANASAGQSCTVDQNGNSNCLGGLSCTNGRCALPPAGMACM